LAKNKRCQVKFHCFIEWSNITHLREELDPLKSSNLGLVRSQKAPASSNEAGFFIFRGVRNSVSVNNEK